MVCQRLLFLLLCLFLKFASLEATATYAQLSSLITQTPRSGGTSVVRMDSLDALQNLGITPQQRDKVIIKEAGVYFVLASAQVGAVNPGAAGYMDIWFIKSGVAVPNSGCRMSVEESSFTSVLITQTVIQLEVGDTIATGYSASGPSLGFVYTKPDNEPAIPSFLFSIYKID